MFQKVWIVKKCPEIFIVKVVQHGTWWKQGISFEELLMGMAQSPWKWHRYK